jgi:carbon-monoxide dehydrogenase small subunit
MELVVNGVSYDVDSGPMASLLDVLRNELDITSPKAGCETGSCGACTVLIEGEPRRSCLTAVCMTEGLAVTTVEGLGTPEALSAVQKAFIQHYAAQCGFCTSGMVVAAAAYVDGGGTPDRAAIQSALSGHFCRCTGYVKILEAVAHAARGDTDDLSVTVSGPNTRYVTIEGGGGP